MTRHKTEEQSLKQVFSSSGNSKMFVVTGSNISRVQEIVSKIMTNKESFSPLIKTHLKKLELLKLVTTDLTSSTQLYDVIPPKDFLTQREHRTFALQWGDKNSKFTGIPTKSIGTLFEKGCHGIIPLGMDLVNDFQWFSQTQIKVISITGLDEKISPSYSSEWCHITDTPEVDITNYIAMICSEQIARQ